MTRRTWGFASRGEESIGAYFVSWTKDKPDHGATFDLVLGVWGPTTTQHDRYWVSLDCRLINGGPQFMVVDAADRKPPADSMFEEALSRAEVIGTPLAPHVFALVDAGFMSKSAEDIRRWSDS